MLKIIITIISFSFLLYGTVYASGSTESVLETEENVKNMEGESLDPTVGGIYGNMVRWTVYAVIMIMTVAVFGFYLKTLWLGPAKWTSEISPYHLSITFGAPFQTFFAVLCSLFIVLLLRYSTGPIEFEGLGFKFRGASGPIVLWILCFLSIITGLYFTGLGALKNLKQ